MARVGEFVWHILQTTFELVSVHPAQPALQQPVAIIIITSLLCCISHGLTAIA
jgi:hypothetical protein